MNTVSTTVKLIAIAAVAASLIAPSAAFASTPDSAPVSAIVNGVSVPVAHQGPGVGSVKSAPFAWLSNAPAAPMSFHATASAPVQHQGPGLGSVKSPAAR
ncbi:MAG TPA: hypothetical protein VGK19_26075 [Capsulimonadaceae bacterium]